MKIAIIGTVGVPANYGGFETLVEQLITHNHSDDLQYTVYCSKKAYKEQRWVYRGAKIEYIGLNANGIQSILYDIISLLKAARESDAILILGVSGCIFLPIFRIFSKKRLIINIDGLEHKRDKWNGLSRRLLKVSEYLAVKYGSVIVADNQGITDYLLQEYAKPSKLIAYGGDHVFRNVTQDESESILSSYGLTSKQYSLAVSRIEPENNVRIILEAFSRTPDKQLVYIGNWQRSSYGQDLEKQYSKFANIKILPAIYDLTILNVLRGNCFSYLHGHSAGGTNPSLVEAMFFSIPILAYDVVYNRETTENKARYFTSSEDLVQLMNSGISQGVDIGGAMFEIAQRRYKWETIVKQYIELYRAESR